jgi:hypothetical protein
MRKHQPSYYLTEEAEERRLVRLIDRIAREGLKPGESVPARIMVLADMRRGEMRAVA